MTDSTRARKVAGREICAIQPAARTPSKWCETPITFTKEDQWHGYSNPGRYPLVLEPIMGGSLVSRTLIDGGSGLNIIFAKTLREMGLDLSSELTPGETGSKCDGQSDLPEGYGGVAGDEAVERRSP